MKRKFSILIVSAVIIGLALSLVGMALTSQTASAEKDQNSSKQVPKPVSATDVKVIKKIPAPDIGETKDKPSPPGQDKKPPGKEEEKPAATGVLGELATGNKYAVVIGICDYPGTANDICASDGDSLNMYKALTTLYGYDPANIYLFKDMGGTYFEENTTDSIPTIIAEKPTRENILSAISAINASSTSSGDEVVFFFSGHGATGIADDGDGERIDEAIVVHNASSMDIDYIWDGELKTAFSGFATNRIAFIFDTCRAGGMNDLATSGRVISMATGENQVAYVYSTAEEDVDGDGTPDGEGVFSHYFVNEGMLKGLADKYDHNKNNQYCGVGTCEPSDVVVEEAFDYANEIIPDIYKRQDSVISDNFIDNLLL